MLNVCVYFCCFFTVYVLIPSVILAILFKVDKKKILNVPEMLLVSAALGPAITSTALYYLLLLFPKQPSIMYFSAIHIIILILLIIFRSSFLSFFRMAFAWFKSLNKNSSLQFKLFIVSLLLFVAVWQFIVFVVPLLRHDTYEYGVWGQHIFKDRIVSYLPRTCDPNSGFYYVAKHGLSFPLFLTWGSIYNDVFKVSSDYFFRSITGWYWMLIVCFVFYYLEKRDKLFALLGVLALVTIPAFSGALIYYHVDTYRIFFILVTLFVLTKLIKKFDNLLLILFGILSGVMVNAHAIGVIFAVLFYFVYVVFVKQTLKSKLRNLFIVTALIIIFGGLHYVLDLLWGTGWILGYKLL